MTRTVEDEEVEELPSTEIYAALDEDTGSSECDSIKGIKEKWITYPYIKTHRDKIERGICNIHEEEGNTLSPEQRCGFLFYWIIDRIRRNLGHRTFDSVSANVYNLLKELNCNFENSSVYSGMGEDIFKRSKEIFDYNYNNSALPKYPNCKTYSGSQDYAKLQRDAESAYSKLCDICGERDDGYCKEIREGSGNSKKRLLHELACREVPEADPESMAATAGPLTGEHLKHLPSIKMYSRVSEKAKTYGNAHCNSNVKEGIEGPVNDTTTVEKIMKVLCYIYEIKNRRIQRKKWCDYFYYWVGDMLSGILDDFTFTAAITSCYTRMKQTKTQHGCEFMYLHDREAFKALKKLVDFKKDENKIKEQLGNGNKECTKEYHTYLESIKDAYQKVRGKCTDKQNNECYRKFKELYGDIKNVEDLKLSCKLEGNEQPQQETPPAEGTSGATSGFASGGGGSALSTIVPATLPIVGLPAAAFFLYKYTNVFSGIKSSFGGSSTKRRKRTTTIEHDFNDTLTEGTLTTEYSTLGSTIGSREESSIYDGSTSPSGRRGRNNNSNRRGNENRKNIPYQRM